MHGVDQETGDSENALRIGRSRTLRYPFFHRALPGLAVLQILTYRLITPNSDDEMRRFLPLALLFAAARSAEAQSGVLPAMQQELARSLQTLKSQPTAPYFLSYEITETRSAAVHGSFGTITGGGEEHRRLLGIDLRVGTPTFDNTHEVAGNGEPFGMFARFSLSGVPLGDDTIAIRRVMWYQTDKIYKRAVEQLARAKAGAQLRVAPEDTSPDFSPEPAAKHIEPIATAAFDRAAWEQRIRSYTAPFAKYTPTVLRSVIGLPSYDQVFL